MKSSHLMITFSQPVRWSSRPSALPCPAHPLHASPLPALHSSPWRLQPLQQLPGGLSQPPSQPCIPPAGLLPASIRRWSSSSTGIPSAPVRSSSPPGLPSAAWLPAQPGLPATASVEVDVETVIFSAFVYKPTQRTIPCFLFNQLSDSDPTHCFMINSLSVSNEHIITGRMIKILHYFSVNIDINENIFSLILCVINIRYQFSFHPLGYYW